MSYTVCKVLEWHKRQHRRRWAKTTVLHSGPYSDLQAAYKTRSLLNSGKKQQQYWVLDEKGRVS